MLVLLHARSAIRRSSGRRSCATWPQEMQRRGLPMDLEKDGLVETLARTLWGWVTMLTMVLAMCARVPGALVAVAGERPAGFGAEFRELRLGRGARASWPAR